MGSLRVAALSSLLAFGAGAAVSAEQEPSMAELSREFLKAIPPDTITNVRALEVNGFRIESSRYKQLGGPGGLLEPNGREYDSIFVTAPGLFVAAIDKAVAPTVGGGLSVFHRDSGTPLLSLADTDADGVPDYIEYSSVNANGEVVVTVMDFDADGQPDQRMNFAERYSEIWHRDRWYRIETRGSSRGIVVGDEYVELRKDKSRWVVP